jgi:hypothetical protein
MDLRSHGREIDFVTVLTDLSDIGHLSIVGLPEEALEPAGLEETVFLPVDRHHPEAESLMVDGTFHLLQGFRH